MDVIIRKFVLAEGLIRVWWCVILRETCAVRTLGHVHVFPRSLHIEYLRSAGHIAVLIIPTSF